jgi:hypothetical protein
MNKCICVDCEGRFGYKEPFKLYPSTQCKHCGKTGKMFRPNIIDSDVNMCTFCLKCGKCNSIWHCHCNAGSHYTNYYYDDADQEDHVSGHCSKCRHYFDIMCPSDETIKKVKECDCK